MKKVQAVASSLVLAAVAFAGAAHAGGDRYYDENPNPGHTHNNTHNNNHHNNTGDTYNNTTNTTNNTTNTTTNNTTNNTTSYSNQQEQQQAQQQSQYQNANANANATGGAGGQGGAGGNGYGGNGYGGSATGGNATGGSADANSNSASTATGGNANANATGGNSTSNAMGGQSNATGGQSNATGGVSSSGGNSISNSNHWEAPKPMGYVGSVNIIPASNCGTGWAMNVSIPFFGVGGGKSDISNFCLSQQAAQTAINAGLVAKDTGMVATGLKGLRNLHPEFDAAAKSVIVNLKKPCAAQAAKISAIMLTDDDLQCDGAYIQGTRDFVQQLEAAAAPAAAPKDVTVNVQFPDRMKVEIDGVVQTKEQYTPRKGPPAKPRPLQVEIVKMPCTTVCPAPAPAPKQ